MIDLLFAGNTLLILFGLLFIFHILIMFKVIPYGIVWAGKIKNRNELIKMESISILVLIIASTIVALKMGYLIFIKNPTIINIGLWVLVAFFTLNTIGNMTAKNPIEKYGFGFLTLLMVLLLLRLAII
jgi:hypothetical protein